MTTINSISVKPPHHVDQPRRSGRELTRRVCDKRGSNGGFGRRCGMNRVQIATLTGRFDALYGAMTTALFSWVLQADPEHLIILVSYQFTFSPSGIPMRGSLTAPRLLTLISFLLLMAVCSYWALQILAPRPAIAPSASIGDNAAAPNLAPAADAVRLAASGHRVRRRPPATSRSAALLEAGPRRGDPVGGRQARHGLRRRRVRHRRHHGQVHRHGQGGARPARTAGRTQDAGPGVDRRILERCRQAAAQSDGGSIPPVPVRTATPTSAPRPPPLPRTAFQPPQPPQQQESSSRSSNSSSSSSSSTSSSSSIQQQQPAGAAGAATPTASSRRKNNPRRTARRDRDAPAVGAVDSAAARPLCGPQPPTYAALLLSPVHRPFPIRPPDAGFFRLAVRHQPRETAEAECPTRSAQMITFKNLTLRRGVKVVLQAASATINPGEKVGLVGRNGAGKSSLFALLTGELHADARRLRDAAGLAAAGRHFPGGAVDAGNGRQRDRFRDGRRHPAAGGAAGACRGGSGP